jgi:hypothetical protein
MMCRPLAIAAAKEIMNIFRTRFPGHLSLGLEDITWSARSHDVTTHDLYLRS